VVARILTYRRQQKKPAQPAQRKRRRA
jgi:hypothetical protein